MMGDVLENLCDFDVTECEDGVQALAELAKGHVDVVLADVNMPNWYLLNLDAAMA
jgi:CheY-like chemotaxis protein